MLGVTGGVAAYKAVDLASKLTQAGAQVRTVLTESACKMVTTHSFEAVTRGDVYTIMWNDSTEHNAAHISLADWADVAVIAPATADIIGKIAGGICDDLLSTAACACWQKPWVIAPAMNERMWDNPAVQRNISFIRQLGWELAGPETGHLACGTEGIGRMTQPESILDLINKIAGEIKNR